MARVRPVMYSATLASKSAGTVRLLLGTSTGDARRANRLTAVAIPCMAANVIKVAKTSFSLLDGQSRAQKHAAACGFSVY